MRPLVLGTKLDESSHSRLETKEPEVPYKKGTSGERIHSHSIVAGGLLVMSYTIRLIPCTSLTIRTEIRSSTS